ncbi:MAG: hypothetical protein Pars2KO_32000 [Parasphingorhabdus sp.]
MKMTPFNTLFFAIAVLVGLFVGLQYPGVAILFLFPVVGLVAFILLRNKSGAIADSALMAEAMKLIPGSGKSRIYVMRKGFVGGQQGMNITINGEMQSQIRTKYFLMAEVDPGEHSILAQMSSGTKGAAVTHDISLKSGESVLLDMKLNMGALQGKPDFTEIRDMVQAKAMLNGLKLVEWK